MQSRGARSRGLLPTGRLARKGCPRRLRPAVPGGSVTHANGVIDALRELGVGVVPVTTDHAITGGKIEWLLADVPFAAKGLPASAALGGDLALVRAARREARTASFIYQRHARFS